MSLAKASDALLFNMDYSKYVIPDQILDLLWGGEL
jgi:hypothetical protein